MANANKNKGKSWERDVAKHLTDIYGVNFQRVPNSGAFLGLSNFYRAKTLTPEQNLLASGDIIVPKFLSHTSWEMKFYSAFSFDSLLVNNEQLNKWLDQASVGEKIPFVLLKVNHKGGYVIFPSSIKDKLIVDTNYIVYWNTTKESKGAGCWIVVKMDGFFEKNKNAIVALSPENYTIWSSEQLNTTTTQSVSS